MSNAPRTEHTRSSRPTGSGFRRFPAGLLAAIFLLIGLLAHSLAATEEVTVVRSSEAGPYKDAAEKIRAQLAAQGYGVEVLNLADLSDSDEARYKKCIADNKVRVFVAVGTQAATWLHARVPDAVGVLYCMVSDPEQAGLTKGRITQGICTTVAVGEQVKLIREALPQARTIGMIYSRKDAVSTAGMNDLKGQMPEGFTLAAVAIEDSDNVSDAVQKLLESKPDIIWTTADAVVYSAATVRSLLMSALRGKIPVFGFSSAFVHAGALFGIGVEPARQGEQCGQLAVDFLAALKEHKDAEFRQRKRVEEPRYQIAINKIVAKQLDASLADAFIAKAEIVFK